MNENRLQVEEVRRIDPQIAEAIEGEEKRQQDSLELIASENLTSRAVLQAQGSVFNKQVCRGLPWSALLRRVSLYGPGGAAGMLPGEAAL